MELENIILCEVTQAHKVKNHIFFLICKLYTITNAAILLDTDHTKRRLSMGGIEQRKIPKT
jgi:hypothetical protein